MENAFTWLNRIFDYLGQFVPKFLLVKCTQRAVKFVRGKPPKLIMPGLHIYWPLTTNVEKDEIVWRWDEFNPTTLTTLDRQPLSIGYTMCWRIVDMIRAYTECDILFDSLGEQAELPLAQIIHAKKYEEVRDMMAIPLGKRGSLDGLLTRKVRREVKRFGVEVDYCRVHFDAPSRVFKLLQEEK